MSSVPLRRATPLWRRPHRLVVLALLAVGFAILLAGYLGTSGTRDLEEQVLWVNVGAVGLLVAGAGVVFFLAAGRRAVGRRRLALFGDPDPRRDPVGAADLLEPATLIATPKMTRYHRAGCSFAEGKAAVPASRVEHEEAGRRPCGVCLPQWTGGNG